MNFIFSFSDESEKLNESNLKIIDNNIVRDKFYISLEEFVRLIAGSYVLDGDDTYKSRILPRNCIQYNTNSLKKTWEMICDLPANFHDIKAFNDETAYVEVGLPRLLIKYVIQEIEENKFQLNQIYLYSLKGTSLVEEDTNLYKFPLSNVASNGKMCTGTNSAYIFNNFAEIENLHNTFLFQTVFTTDYYDRSNLSSYSLDQLLENLQGKSFPEEWLFEHKLKFRDII
ncbi:hypothetical protein COF65_32255 [Bacillus toyonensis]|uniref:hypothetical protein n=1 Tax=Bacillus cereus group TaxID=86661 RepID=UPI000BF3ACCF|nr:MULTISPECIES: hypothetical protein [Bacillus cereus group]PEQ70175.1 hypothetical protein CN474_18590 [Bacillus thuringiensis]PHD31435.1 hypothetical protein COF65_32255 [Bacillus toyonensis]